MMRHCLMSAARRSTTFSSLCSSHFTVTGSMLRLLLFVFICLCLSVCLCVLVCLHVQLAESSAPSQPSGSTTAALIYLMYHLTNMMDQYDYVHLIALDFSKAFDTVRHSTLLQKTADLCIDDQLYNWIAHFLSDRQHLVNHNGENTASLTINSSIILGSGIGPVYCISLMHLISILSAPCSNTLIILTY